MHVHVTKSIKKPILYFTFMFFYVFNIFINDYVVHYIYIHKLMRKETFSERVERKRTRQSSSIAV